MKKIIIIVLCLFFISGCSYQELNDLAIVTSLGIDFIDEEYVVSAQIMDMQKGDGDSSTEKAILYNAKGDSIVSALRNIMKQYPRTIYLGHLELLVLGKDVIENKTNEIFDYFISSPESSSDFMVFANKEGTALEIIDPNTKDEEANPTKELLSSLKNLQNHEGSAFEINFEEFLAAYLEEGKDPVIPVIKVKKDKKDKEYSNTIITTLVPFKENALKNELSEEQAYAYNTLNDNYYDMPIKAKYEQTNMSILLLNPKSQIDLKLKNNKIFVDIKTKLEGHTSEVNKAIVLSAPAVANKIEDIFEKKVKSYILSLLDFCKTNNVDILGLKSMIYKHYYKEYNNYKNLNIYDIANINVDVTIDLYRYGNAYVGVAAKK